MIGDNYTFFFSSTENNPTFTLPTNINLDNMTHISLKTIMFPKINNDIPYDFQMIINDNNGQTII